jgi:hypothetical protein
MEINVTPEKQRRWAAMEDGSYIGAGAPNCIDANVAHVRQHNTQYRRTVRYARARATPATAPQQTTQA